jgi:hypothetical protein
MYVYLQSEPGLWTVGFYTPDGKWESESDHESAEAAAQRVHWLNGAAQGERVASDEAEARRHTVEEQRINELEMWGPEGRPRDR